MPLFASTNLAALYIWPQLASSPDLNFVIGRCLSHLPIKFLHKGMVSPCSQLCPVLLLDPIWLWCVTLLKSQTWGVTLSRLCPPVVFRPLSYTHQFSFFDPVTHSAISNPHSFINIIQLIKSFYNAPKFVFPSSVSEPKPASPGKYVLFTFIYFFRDSPQAVSHY